MVVSVFIPVLTISSTDSDMGLVPDRLKRKSCRSLENDVARGVKCTNGRRGEGKEWEGHAARSFSGPKLRKEIRASALPAGSSWKVGQRILDGPLNKDQYLAQPRSAPVSSPVTGSKHRLTSASGGR